MSGIGSQLTDLEIGEFFRSLKTLLSSSFNIERAVYQSIPDIFVVPKRD